MQDDHESSLELVELSALEFFSSKHQNAQRQTSAAEGPGKCMCALHRRSNRTIQRHKKAKRDLEAQGFLSLPEFFKQKAIHTGQQENQAQIAPSKEPEHKNKANEANKTETNAEIEAIANAHSAEGGMMATLVLEEEEEEEEAREEVEVDTVSMHALEEEEWTESKTENAWTTGDLDVCSTDDGTTLLSQSDSGDMVPFYRHWGPSQRLLCESEESLSTDDTTQSNPKDLNSASARELEGLDHGNTPDDTAAQQPMDSTVDLLRDCAGLQGVQG